MRRLWGRRRKQPSQPTGQPPLSMGETKRRVDALFDLLNSIHGTDRLVLKAGKLDALQLMRSSRIEERVLALQRLIMDDPTLTGPLAPESIPQILGDLQDQLADTMARQAVQDEIEHRIAIKMQERHEEYVRDLRNQVDRKSVV